MRSFRLRQFAPLLALVLFGAALWFLHRALGAYRYHDILQQFHSIPANRVALALFLTVLSYLVMTAYDYLAIEYVAQDVEKEKVALASFISYAFSNNIGLSLLTSGSIRYRLYSAWGLSVEQITKVVGFTTLTFWLGIISVGGGVFLAAPLAMPAAAHLPVADVRPLGFLCLAAIAAYLLFVSRCRKPFKVKEWAFVLPTPALALAQLAVGALDWLLAGSVLYALLPAAAHLSFFQLLGIFLLAQLVALISHVPGGLGVFESFIILFAPGVSPDTLIGVLLVYRAIYYLFPLAMAAVLLGGTEILLKKTAVASVARLVGRWVSVLVPQLLAAGTLAAGAILLFSGATPTVPDRLEWLRAILPLPVVEISHFMGSLAGAGLLILARGIQRRLDAAYLLTVMFLAAGSLFSLLKGIDYEEALLLALMLAALLPCRRHFYRRASLFSEPFSSGWIITILLVLVCSVWLGMFAYKHVAYSNELWWHFALRGDAPRFLRSAVGATTLLLLFALTKLLRPVSSEVALPDTVEMAQVRAVIGQVAESSANLALLGDKSLLFNEARTAFIMYAVEGRSWVALGDPVGAKEEQVELAWSFRELCERHGGWPVFYEVRPESLPLYLDLGLSLIKLGEYARVALSEFSLEGSSRSGLRYIHRRLEKEGCRFEIVPAAGVAGLLDELKAVSDAWLVEKNTREKGFSLGFFQPDYLCSNPVALVRQKERIIAFANLWPGAGREELSIDLMRFLPTAPSGVMDYLFVSLMLWGHQEGYRWFNLGMAPLAGLENRHFAPLSQQIGALIYLHGEHFYNFQGLRGYKDKFNPVWEPRYLVSPGGMALPRILTNIASLISGGLRGVVGK